MVIAKANRETVFAKKESVFKTNPGGTAETVNFVTESININNERINSATVRADTNVADAVRVGIGPGGALPTEIQYGNAADIFYDGLFRSTFSTDIGISGVTTISAANADNSYNGSGGSEFANATVGQWIKVTGFTTTANNDWALVTSKPSNAKIIVAGPTLQDEVAGDAITMKGSVISNSTTDASYTIEKYYEDITQYLLYTGQRVGSCDVALGTKAIGTQNFSFVGAGLPTRAGSSGFSGANGAASTKFMNTVNNIKAIYIDRVKTTLDFTQFNFTITTNPEALPKLSSLEAADVSTGSIGVTGTIETYILIKLPNLLVVIDLSRVFIPLRNISRLLSAPSFSNRSVVNIKAL